MKAKSSIKKNLIMKVKKNVKGILGILAVIAVLCSGCQKESNDEVIQYEGAEETADEQILETRTSAPKTVDTPAVEEQPSVQEIPKDTQSGEDLDVIQPDAADDKWYMKGSVYTDDAGRKLEVFSDDYGTLTFAVDGLSLYFANADNFQYENNWRIYTCDDGTVIIFYPGEPAHLEISDGEYAGLYEAGSDKAE